MKKIISLSLIAVIAISTTGCTLLGGSSATAAPRVENVSGSSSMPYTDDVTGYQGTHDSRFYFDYSNK
ncbi:MAG: hypothetical protein LBL35_07140 [Clostridiales bacterium]|jgi:hypothetical protein|nr:hypothetical protein [Clostridiales bacterium]